MTTSKTSLYYAILLISFTALIYSPTLWNGFTLDDVVIFDADYPRTVGDGWRLLVEPVPSRLVSYYRPLTFFSFAVDFSWWGKNPLGYHLTNILFAGLAAFAVFLLARHLLPLDQALFAAMLFAALPGHSEAVISVYNRSQVLSALFMLLALSLFAKVLRQNRPHRGAMLTAGAMTLLGCLAKESAIVTPALALLLAVLFRPQRKMWLHVFGSLALQGIACLTYLILRYYALETFGFPGVDWFLRNQSPATRYFTSSYLFSKYLQLAFLPLALSCDYPAQPVSWHFPAFIYPLVALLCAYLLWRPSKSRNRQLFAFCLTWFALALLPVLHIVPLQISLAERLLYPATPAVAIFFAAAIGSLPKRAWLWGGMIAVCMAALTFDRCFDWRDNDTLWRRTLRTNPDSYRARIYIANQMMRANHWQQALWQYQNALHKKPNANNRLLIYTNAARAHFALGDPAEAQRILREAFRIDPDYPPAWLLLANAARTEERWDDAVYCYEKALQDSSGWGVNGRIRTDIHRFLAQIAYRRRQWRRAIHHYEKIENADPTHLGRCYAALGHWSQAYRHYRQALAQKAGDYNVHVHLAATAMELGRHEEARRYLEKALTLDARPYQAHYLLAVWHHNSENRKQAAEHYRKANKLLPPGQELPPLERSDYAMEEERR